MSYIKIEKILKESVDTPESGYVYFGYDDESVGASSYGFWIKNDNGDVNYILSSSENIPTITSIDPADSAFNGDLLTINGTNFVSNMIVKFNDISVTDTNKISPNQISVVVPNDITGNVSIVVQSIYGSSSGYSYIINYRSYAPIITSISPASTAPINSTININGYNFIAGETVIWYGGVSGTTNVSNSIYLSAVIPLSIQTTGETAIFLSSSKGSGNIFTYTITPSAGPTFTSFTPSSGSVGDLIKIYGTNFKEKEISVFFGDVFSSEITLYNSGYLTARIANGTHLGETKINVGSNILDGFTVLGSNSGLLPSITSISPTEQSIGGNVFIQGENLDGATITFSSVLTSILSGSSTGCTVYLNANVVPGINTVKVINKYGESISPYYYIVPHAIYSPTIVDTTPSNAYKGKMIYLSGTSYVVGTGNAVYFGNKLAGPYLAGITTNQIKAQIPTNAPTGDVDIKVVNANGSYTYPYFTIDASGSTPFVTSVSPVFAKAGETIDIYGSNLSGSTVSFGYAYQGYSTTTVEIDDTHLQTILPPTMVNTGESRLINVYVTSDIGSTTFAPFEVYSDPVVPPIVSSVSTSTITVGDQITIYGNYFNKYYSVASIYINTKYYLLESQKYINNNTITGYIPDLGGFTGLTFIKVENQAGSNQIGGITVV